MFFWAAVGVSEPLIQQVGKNILGLGLYFDHAVGRDGVLVEDAFYKGPLILGHTLGGCSLLNLGAKS